MVHFKTWMRSRFVDLSKLSFWLKISSQNNVRTKSRQINNKHYVTTGRFAIWIST